MDNFGKDVRLAIDSMMANIAENGLPEPLMKLFKFELFVPTVSSSPALISNPIPVPPTNTALISVLVGQSFPMLKGVGTIRTVTDGLQLIVEFDNMADLNGANIPYSSRLQRELIEQYRLTATYLERMINEQLV